MAEVVDKKEITDKEIIELRKCQLRNEIKAYFERKGLSANAGEKIRYLKAATRETDAYYAGGNDDLTPEDIYLDDEEIFLEGTWRLLLT